MTPWQHYVIDGRLKGFDNGNHPTDSIFFREGYELEYPDVKAAGVDPWRHFAEKGLAEGRDNGHHPSESQFFACGYLEMYPDVAKSGKDAWHHYVLAGKKEGRDNGLHPSADQFFADGYTAMYPDVAAAGIEPWHHYVLAGKKEGRDNGLHPSADQFFAEGYSQMYPDVAESGSDPWHHYVLAGKKEGRDNGLHPSEDQFLAFGYIDMYPDIASLGLDSWHHYVFAGKKEGRDNGLHLYPLETGMRELLKKKNPSVAVIMPTFNRKHIVMHAISSVQNQSWNNWHLYVVDDFSDDGTYEFLKSVIVDPRITILKSQYKGVCGARNTAIAHIKNEDYVAYLDSDNTWNKEYLELMLCRLLETNTYCCYGILKRFQRECDGSVKNMGLLYENFNINKLHNFNYIDQNVFMHRTSVFKEIGVFDQSLRRMVDWDLILRCAERYSFSRLPYVSCNYDSTEDKKRITSHGYSYTCNYINVIRNKHWVDWKFLSDNKKKIDECLVSVILYFGRHGSVSHLQRCIHSIKSASVAGRQINRTEIIVVDDSCNADGHRAVADLYHESMIDKYLVNQTECFFPLSCNCVLNVANGQFTVYLDSHSEVSAGWLDPLIEPLKRHKELKGTTSRVLRSDGVLNSIGCMFDSVSGIPYDVLHGFPSDFAAAGRFSLFPCVNSYCCAFRTSDVISERGLYCLYASRLSIADLCLQIAGGTQCFAYIPTSSVVYKGCRSWPSPDEVNDLMVFEERWFGKTSRNEQFFYARRNISNFIKGNKKVCSISFNKYSKTGCKKYTTDCFVPIYDTIQTEAEGDI